MTGGTLVPSSHGFPWTSSHPTRGQRAIVASTIALAAAALNYFRAAGTGGHSDFSYVWFGARMLLEGHNPYQMIGPGKLIDLPTSLFYPAPSFVAVMPLTVLSFHLAGAVFVLISTFLFAWGSTRDGWHRLPIFPSIVFLTSAQLGQWSILMAAAVFIPVVALVGIARPQSSVAIVSSSSSPIAFGASFVGGLVLLGISFFLMPTWVSEWRHALGTTGQYVAPIARTGGVAIALVLLRWRRSDAWLVLVAACVPQTPYPYNGLLLLLVAESYREACVLSLFSSAVWMIVFVFFPGEMRSDPTREFWGALLVASSYLPAALLVLRRPNIGPSPWWLSMLGAGKAGQINATHESP